MEEGKDMMWWHHGGGIGQWIVMSLSMGIFVGVLVAITLSLMRGARSEASRATSASPTPTDRADVLLAERFARGEIDDAEFTHSREVLHPASHTA